MLGPKIVFFAVSASYFASSFAAPTASSGVPSATHLQNHPLETLDINVPYTTPQDLAEQLNVDAACMLSHNTQKIMPDKRINIYLPFSCCLDRCGGQVCSMRPGCSGASSSGTTQSSPMATAVEVYIVNTFKSPSSAHQPMRVTQTSDEWTPQHQSTVSASTTADDCTESETASKSKETSVRSSRTSGETRVSSSSTSNTAHAQVTGVSPAHPHTLLDNLKPQETPSCLNDAPYFCGLGPAGLPTHASNSSSVSQASGSQSCTDSSSDRPVASVTTSNTAATPPPATATVYVTITDFITGTTSASTSNSSRSSAHCDCHSLPTDAAFPMAGNKDGKSARSPLNDHGASPPRKLSEKCLDKCAHSPHHHHHHHSHTTRTSARASLVTGTGGSSCSSSLSTASPPYGNSSATQSCLSCQTQASLRLPPLSIASSVDLSTSSALLWPTAASSTAGSIPNTMVPSYAYDIVVAEPALYGS